MDGSFDYTSNKASCGGLARNDQDQGEWMKGFTYGIGTCLEGMVEAWVLLKGIQMAKLLGVRQVCFESDSKTIVNAITNDFVCDSLTDNVLFACKKELADIQAWHLAFIPRELNTAVDHLAKFAGGRKGTTILHQPSESILQCLEDDKSGLPIWRQLETESL
ncbi:uncharacterized protein LOC116004059 [Ipomoea triloba]|uniref:uncharacterized protein LOC116004059 n=1 Tax=Ipomoea triloba TaxID=35885 RepID=UPI00125D0BF1|nr:uncharacterized protein LOC116004059 [Ipomoea triloba]